MSTVMSWAFNRASGKYAIFLREDGSKVDNFYHPLVKLIADDHSEMIDFIFDYEREMNRI